MFERHCCAFVSSHGEPFFFPQRSSLGSQTWETHVREPDSSVHWPSNGGTLVTGCDDDTDCPTAQICDANAKQCVPGCRPSADGGPHGLCPDPANQNCVPRDGAPDIGDCVPKGDGGAGDGGLVDAGDTYGAGLVEGGGCACRSSVAAASPPLALFAMAAAGILAARRRRSGR